LKDVLANHSVAPNDALWGKIIFDQVSNQDQKEENYDSVKNVNVWMRSTKVTIITDIQTLKLSLGSFKICRSRFCFVPTVEPNITVHKTNSAPPDPHQHLTRPATQTEATQALCLAHWEASGFRRQPEAPEKEKLRGKEMGNMGDT